MSMKGKHHTEEWKQSMSKKLSGKDNPFYGKKHTKKSLQKMIKQKTGKYNPNYGKHFSKEHKKRIGDAQCGKKNHNWGKHHTKEWKEFMHKKMSGKNNPMYNKHISGDKSYWWKGDNVSYEGLHIWLKKNMPKPETCEMCNWFKPKHISNISGEYRRDVNDYQWLCVQCHSVYDTQIKEVIGLSSIERRQKYKVYKV